MTALLNPLLSAPQDDAETIPPAAITRLTGGDIQRIGRTLSEKVRTIYDSAWGSFQACIDARGVLAMPACPPRVAASLSHLSEERRSSMSTARLLKAALTAVHKAACHQTPTVREEIRQMMKSMPPTRGGTEINAEP